MNEECTNWKMENNFPICTNKRYNPTSLSENKNGEEIRKHLDDFTLAWNLVREDLQLYSMYYILYFN